MEDKNEDYQNSIFSYKN